MNHIWKNKDGRHYDKQRKTPNRCSNLVKFCGLDEDPAVEEDSLPQPQRVFFLSWLAVCFFVFMSTEKEVKSGLHLSSTICSLSGFNSGSLNVNMSAAPEKCADLSA